MVGSRWANPTQQFVGTPDRADKNCTLNTKCRSMAAFQPKTNRPPTAKRLHFRYWVFSIRGVAFLYSTVNPKRLKYNTEYQTSKLDSSTLLPPIRLKPDAPKRIQHYGPCVTKQKRREGQRGYGYGRHINPGIGVVAKMIHQQTHTQYQRHYESVTHVHRTNVKARLRLVGLSDNSGAPVPGKDRRRIRERDKVKAELKTLPQQELNRLILTLEEEMHEAAAELKFEYAARLRDEVNELRRELRDAT